VHRNPIFVTTHWSVVLAAGKCDTMRADLALEKLCETYWYPLYAYVRRSGCSAHDVQNLTQAFFACLLECQSLANANPELGRFRSYILDAMKYFLSGEWAKMQRQKRGSGRPILSLDTVHCVGCEDAEELIQNATAIAAGILHQAEAAGKKVAAASVAYYSIGVSLLLNHGLRAAWIAVCLQGCATSCWGRLSEGDTPIILSGIASLPDEDFRTTRWMQVRRAKADSPEGRRAVTELCNTYYEPVAAFLRCALAIRL
jgi:hypothetical protein